MCGTWGGGQEEKSEISARNSPKAISIRRKRKKKLAGLSIPNSFSKSAGLIDDLKYGKSENDIKKRRFDPRKIYFVVHNSSYFKIPISKILKRVLKMFDLKWLRISISFKVFASIASLVNADTNRKVWQDFDDLDKIQRPCNCREVDNRGICFYGGGCRVSNAIYKLKCHRTSKCYFGHTCRHVKTRTGEHTGDVKQQRLHKVDSFSEHFYGIWLETGATQLPSRRDVRKLFSYETLWTGNSLQLNKNFGTNRCGLCAKERYIILQFSDYLRDTSKLINYKSEVFFGCRHKPRFINFTARRSVI